MLSVNIAAYFYRVTDNIADIDILHYWGEKRTRGIFEFIPGYNWSKMLTYISNH